MSDGSFALGDHVEILCRDGATFAGVLTDFNAQYLTLGMLGFPHADVLAMTHA